ncbi:MAG: metal-binding protein [Halomonadaceae bacterium]|nr:metal-binding protein [Halomonadaceae bacterium]
MKYFKKLLFTTLFIFPVSSFADGIAAALYKNPNCGCCAEHANYLEDNGFDVKVIETNDLAQFKVDHNVTKKLYGCHSTLIGDYIFEGHVNAESIKKVLENNPSIKGLSVPGMPLGSPGMGGEKQGPIEVYTLTSQPTDSPEVYATY